MKKLSRQAPIVREQAATDNPLWIITALLAIFFCAVAAIVAWG